GFEVVVAWVGYGDGSEVEEEEEGGSRFGGSPAVMVEESGALMEVVNDEASSSTEERERLRWWIGVEVGEDSGSVEARRRSGSGGSVELRWMMASKERPKLDGDDDSAMWC
ncbi:hypothetical protein PIB30_108989, partial [Stylosanthes scabra]|nr:hypothetical protein [Stylosanthes scabra]